MDDSRLREILEGRSYALFDGAMGTMLVREGLGGADLPELLCLSDPGKIEAIHRAYVNSGSEFATTNTFGATSRKLGDSATVRAVYEAAVSCARNAGARFVAADIGPIGELFFPMGDLSFTEAYELFAEQARAAEAAGADLVIVETMADVLEAVCAVMAVKDSCSLPVIATMTFLESGRTFLGSTPESAALALGALGVDALGVNCSAGPDDLLPVVNEMLAVAPCPVVAQANAGLPKVVDGQTVYDLGPEAYAASVARLVDAGATIVGGCCGTDPSYLSQVAALLEGRIPTREAVDAQRSRELARCAADEEGRDAQIIAMILEADGPSALREMLADEFDE